MAIGERIAGGIDRIRARTRARSVLGYFQRLFLQLSLHRRIAVFTSSIVIALFLAFAYLGWAAVTQSTAATLQERRATALVLARHLDNFVANARDGLEITAEDLARDGSLGTDRLPHALDRSLRHVHQYFSHLVFFDPDGRVLAASSPLPAAPPSPAASALLERVRASGQPAISGRLRLPGTGASGVLFVVPVLTDNHLYGLLAGEMPLPNPSISSIVSGLELGRTGHLDLIDASGSVLASSQRGGVSDAAKHADFYLPLLATGRSAVGRAMVPNGAAGEEAHVMAFAPLSNVDWGVGLGQSEADTFAATYELRDRTLAAAAIALALSLCFAWLGTRSVVSPVRALTRAGERMATGDLSEPIGVEQPDEIGGLARVLEEMRLKLRQSLAETTALNQQLEQRVRDRTRDLETSNRHLHAIMAVATLANAGSGREEVLARGLEKLVEALDAVSGWAFLYDQQHESLRLVAAHGLSDAFEEAEMTVTCADAGCMRALRDQDVVLEMVPRCPALPPGLRHAFRGAHCWSVPIRAGEDRLGVLSVMARKSPGLGDADLALMQGIAHQVAVAFQNARLAEERARLEATRHLEVLRAEFLASVSHELRTPLGFIKGYATTLLRDDVQWHARQQREFLEIIDEECDHLSELVDGLLDVARARAGRLRLRVESVDVEHVIRRAVERMDGTLKRRRVDLEIGDAGTILADAGRLEQVLLNLLQNAVKYSPEGSPILVTAHREADSVRLGVLDRGIGLPPGETGRIFDPFYRVQGEATARAGGVGLGLAICRSIVEAHGGQIWAERRPEGGTAVYFTLPFDTQVAREQAYESEAHSGR